MSSQSLAAFRKSASEDLRRLADEHLQHEYDKHFPVIFLNFFADTILSLRQSDRNTLEALQGRYLDMLQLVLLLVLAQAFSWPTRYVLRVMQSSMRFAQWRNPQLCNLRMAGLVRTSFFCNASTDAHECPRMPSLIQKLTVMPCFRAHTRHYSISSTNASW